MDTLDLIQAIANKEPVESERIFNELMADRIANKIEDRKAEIASDLLNGRRELEASVDDYTGSADDASEGL
jgi:hypothetical protein